MADDEQIKKNLWQEACNAIDAHDAAKIRSLVSKGLDINSRSPITGHSDATLLMIAAWDASNSEIVELLLELGADVNTEAHCGNVLTRAKGYRNIKLLLDHGANPNIPTKTDKGTPLLYHSEYGNADIVKLLIEHGADIHADWDRIGIGYRNVFSSALSNGHLNVIDVLLESLHEKVRKNEINWASLNNWFYLAVEHKDNSLINRLFSIVVSDRASASVALSSALDNSNYDLAKALIKHGATPDEYEVNEAVLDGDWERVDFLVKNGGAIRADNLPEAARKGDMKAVRFLLKHGANIDEKDGFGGTALHNAVVERHLNLVKILLKKGASINIVNRMLRYDKTPLLTALWQLHENRYEGDVAKTYLQIIEALLKSGADPHFIVEFTDSDGLPYKRSAYELAPHEAEGYENEVMRMFDKYSKKNISKWSLFNIFKKHK
ncbi:MAG: ankyrin repeat domain-containing protein [Desulfovibrionales bacterium]|nr:ankyrin repeat domain-containing protein [Desulfovibrionales bacterium]